MAGGKDQEPFHGTPIAAAGTRGGIGVPTVVLAGGIVVFELRCGATGIGDGRSAGPGAACGATIGGAAAGFGVGAGLSGAATGFDARAARDGNSGGAGGTAGAGVAADGAGFLRVWACPRSKFLRVKSRTSPFLSTWLANAGR